MYLVDTNIWLERLLEQERSAEVGAFLEQTSTDQLAMTDFSLHSIGVILDRLERQTVLLEFVDDVFLQGEVGLISVQPEAMHRLVVVMEQFKLDFDDAYQYVAAEQMGAVIVSFDGDFDRTERKRREPIAILRGNAA
ncbi:MAG: PIN domain-containing protein [Chloroflexi bacterium]|jgi:predicted nucleic acid-binding protein|nr:PIN domain-containing protein [Chloroflexota bacterium]